ncbi:MAG: hypothetical protein IPJ78_11000 [Gemmatimonadetes bacterium]|nr:hypothetical protein [Gemmatimonadota bacterium]MBP7549379.1 hypothetical protein [Gemmatimonadaceae bacterium]
MADAERSVDAPREATRAMDRCVLDYLHGGRSLEDAVNACVAVLGPRPSLSVSVRDADPQMQARLHAFQAALGRPREA